MGWLSDRHGRLLVIGVVLLGQAISQCIIVGMILLRLPVWLLIVGSLVSGTVGGGMISLCVQMTVCLTDLTMVLPSTDVSIQTIRTSTRNQQERHRLLLLGVFDSCLSLSSALGNVVAGSTLEHFGFTVCAIGLLLIFCIPVVLLWFIPETRPVCVSNTSRQRDDEELSSSGSFIETLQATWFTVRSVCSNTLSIMKSHNPLSWLAFLLILLYAIIVFPEAQFVFLYLMAKPFCWSPEYIGLYNGCSGFLTALTTLALIVCTFCSMRMRHIIHSSSPSEFSPGSPISRTSHDLEADESDPLIPRDFTDPRVLRLVWIGRLRAMVYIFVAFISIVISKLVMGIVFLLPAPQRTILVLLSLLLQLVRSSVIPTLKSFLSSLHPPDVQGYLFSLVGLVEYIGSWIGLPCMPGVYALTVHIFPGAVFLLSAGLAVIASVVVGILLWYICKRIPGTASL